MNLWTKEEDELLLKYYRQTQSFKKWKKISLKLRTLGIQKSVYECRERYVNKLDPLIINEKWKNQQVKTLFRFYNINGPKWQQMQTLIPNRTQTQLKNRFYSFLRSFLLKLSQSTKISERLQLRSISSKSIKTIFEGSDEYPQINGQIIKYLQLVDYEMDLSNIQKLVEENQDKINQILVLLKGKTLEKNSEGENISFSFRKDNQKVKNKRKRRKNSKKIQQNIEFQFQDQNQQNQQQQKNISSFIQQRNNQQKEQNQKDEEFLFQNILKIPQNKHIQGFNDYLNNCQQNKEFQQNESHNLYNNYQNIKNDIYQPYFGMYYYFYYV